MIYNLDEKLINENIPRDLLAAYKKANSYPSEQHPKSRHSVEFRDPTRRSLTSYSYGKAKYDEISVDDALALIQQDPHNVEKLRGILEGDLVEYEYRDGKFYCMYANPDRAVSYQKPNGDTVSKRNIRYITNPKIWLPLLDKIYITDEYDYPISDEEIYARSDRNAPVAMSRFTPSEDPTYSQFDPAKHFDRNVSAMRKQTPDTGAHVPPLAPDPDLSHRYFIPAWKTDNTAISVNLSPEAQEMYAEYQELHEKKQNDFNIYNAYRSALRKLERDKTDYDDEEYEELKAKWTKNLKNAKDRYENTALAFSRIKSKIKKDYDSAGNQFTNKLAIVTRKLSNLLKNCINLQKHIDTLKSVDAAKITKDDASRIRKAVQNPEAQVYGSDEHQQERANAAADNALIDSISSISAEVDELINQLQKLKETSENLEATTDTEVQDPTIDVAVQLHQRLVELDHVKKTLMDRYFVKYDELNKKMADIEDSVNEIKPTRAARKARARAAAGQATMDPALVGIIQFDDETA